MIISLDGLIKRYEKKSKNTKVQYIQGGMCKIIRTLKSVVKDILTTDQNRVSYELN